MKKRILITSSTWLHVKCFHLPYIETFKKLGYRVDVACGGVPLELPHADRLIQLPLEKSMLSLKNWKAAWLLKKEIRLQRYDVIICHTSLASFFTRLAVCMLKDRPPVICTVHGYLFDEHTHFLRKLMLVGAEKLTASVTTLLLTMNGWDEKYARKHKLGKKIDSIPGMGVDFTEIKNVEQEEGKRLREKLCFSDEDFLLIYAAEFSRRKNHAFLLNEMTRLPERVKLLLPGEGALKEQCILQAENLGIKDRVVFPGWVSDMPVWYAAADCVVTSSRSEGLPFHIMEAMGSGLPVVASMVKGHMDLVKEGENGFLYPPGDETECVKKIRRLLEDKKLRNKLGKNAQEKAKSYDIARVLPKVMDCYCRVLKEGK